MTSLLAVLTLKPIVGMVLGAAVGSFLAALAALESLCNFKGALDDVLAVALRLGLASIDAIEKMGNVQGMLDDVLRTTRAMFDDYLRYKERRAAARTGAPEKNNIKSRWRTDDSPLREEVPETLNHPTRA
jgi:hypothetical protein